MPQQAFYHLLADLFLKTPSSFTNRFWRGLKNTNHIRQSKPPYKSSWNISTHLPVNAFWICLKNLSQSEGNHQLNGFMKTIGIATDFLEGLVLSIPQEYKSKSLA